jgi:DNA polymerase III epsilon subunit-like protein
VIPPTASPIHHRTTGIDFATAKICEIGAVAECGSAFATVVRPPALPLDTGVHGIQPEEMAQGPAFAKAFCRMVTFLTELSEK